MWTYIIRRVVAIPVTLLVLSFILFLLVYILPGNAAFAVVAGIEEARNIEQFEKELGLDRPWIVQYGDWLWTAVSEGSLGKSLTPPYDTVNRSIRERLPNTLEIGLLTVALSAAIALPVGILSAVRRNGLLDYALRTVTILGISVPNFWTGTLIITYAIVWFGWNPIKEYSTFTEDPLRNLSIIIFPVIVLAYAGAAYTARIVRSSMLEVFYQDHVRTARAKGLRERVVIFRHVFRSALIPVLTVIGIQLGTILGGAIVAEQIFAIPGMGRLTLEALLARDYPVILATVMIFAAIFMIVTLLVDILYTRVDPRIRF